MSLNASITISKILIPVYSAHRMNNLSRVPMSDWILRLSATV